MKFGKLALVPDGPVGSKCDRTRVRASCLPRVFELKIKEFVRPFFRWDSVFCSDDNGQGEFFLNPSPGSFFIVLVLDLLEDWGGALSQRFLRGSRRTYASKLCTNRGKADF